MSARSRRHLRYRLSLLLHAVGRPLTIGEMLTHLEAVGRRPAPPASKAVSDSLRWEIGRGRVRRVSRGVYGAGRLDPRTKWWPRRQLQEWDQANPPAEVIECVSDSLEVPDWLAAVVADTVEGPDPRWSGAGSRTA
jgi:hypothetical protein